MIPSALVLAALVLQQPGPRPSPAANAARLAAFDTSRAVLGEVGRAVGQVKSGIDVYRRAVFNGPDEEVLHNADFLRGACAGVDSVARRAVGRICRRCAEADVQQAFDGYRQMLPTLARGTARCAAQLWQLEQRHDGPARLRHDVRVIGNPLVATLRYYEARLGVLLQALHITPAVQSR